jgi:hypothetical protein
MKEPMESPGCSWRLLLLVLDITERSLGVFPLYFPRVYGGPEGDEPIKATAASLCPSEPPDLVPRFPGVFKANRRHKYCVALNIIPKPP